MVRVLTWNVEWATPRSRRTPEILRRIRATPPEVVCLTEAHARLAVPDGYAICSRSDYGYGIKGGRRKLMLWSREPWERVDDVGADTLPPGRFVSGVTRTSLGEVTVIGVCIPWFGSRTKAGRQAEPKLRWEDHQQFLAGFAGVLARSPAQRLIVAGDFNQVVGPGSRAPRELRDALLNVFTPGMRIATSDIAFGGRGAIDHIAVSQDLAVDSLCVVSNVHDGGRLSDHFGVVAELSARPQ